MYSIRFGIFLFFIKTIPADAQLPITSLYLLNIVNPSDSTWIISKIEYLTSFNSKGYNSQPYFLDGDRILFSAKTEIGQNTDIYLLSRTAKTIQNITNSKASEFSPRVSPQSDHHITCISVPSTDSSIQKLVEIEMNSGKYAKIILDQHNKIGYYRHMHNDIWACFMVDKTNKLGLCDNRLATTQIFASSIGRTFEVLNQHEIIYVDKSTNHPWHLKIYNRITQKSKMVASMPLDTEDFAIDEAGKLYCATGSKILRLENDGHWHALVDLAPLQLRNLSRLTFNKNNLVIVSQN